MGVYTRFRSIWQNLPDTSTPVTAEFLTKVEDTLVSMSSGYAFAPPGITVTVKYGTSWPDRPTTRTDIIVRWVGPSSPAPAGYIAGVDELVTGAAGSGGGTATLTATATAGDGYIDLNWTTTIPTVSTFTVGRDGVDTTGFGAWSTTDPNTATSRRFNQLINGTTYNLYVIANLADGSTVRSDVSARPTAPVGGGSRPFPLIGRSGLAFNSAILNTNDVAGADAFSTKRNRLVDGMMWFLSRASWTELGQGWTTDKASWLASGRILISSMPHAPTSEGTSMNSTGASNGYASQQQSWAAARAAAGFNSPLHVIRLNWECNGDWYPWSIANGGASTFLNAYKNFVINARIGGLTQVKFSLCFNKGPSQAGADYAAFPGASWCDIISIDQYDSWSPSFNDSQWTSAINASPGLQNLVDFAASNNIAWALEEGGNMNPFTAGQYGGDNPFYWQRIWQFFNANAARCAYHVTYDNAGAPSSLHHDFDSNPNSWAEYRQASRFGGF